MTDAAPEWLSEDKIRSHINDLSEEKLRQLRMVAGALIYLDDLNWTIDDLLQEAIKRLLDGQRKWRRDMGLIPMIVGIMKSIAGQQRTAIRHQSELMEADLPETPSGERDERHLEDSGANPAIEAMELEYLTAVQDLFDTLENDILARDILIGSIFGLKRAELIENLRLTPREFDAANTRLKRRIARYVGDREEIL